MKYTCPADKLHNKCVSICVDREEQEENMPS